MSGWVGGWVVDGKVEEKEAVRVSYWSVWVEWRRWVDGRLA